MKTKLLLFAILLMSGICLAQHNPTRFTNSNLPNPDPRLTSYEFNIQTEDGNHVGVCPGNSPGCVIRFTAGVNISITLPDIPNDYVNHDTLACTIKSTSITGKYKCQTAKCQSITYVATGDHDQDYDDVPCRDADGQVWTLIVTEYYHWRKSGLTYDKHYDGGYGTLLHGK